MWGKNPNQNKKPNQSKPPNPTEVILYRYSVLFAPVTTCALLPSPAAGGCSGILRDKERSQNFSPEPSQCLQLQGAGSTSPAPLICSSGENYKIQVISPSRSHFHRDSAKLPVLQRCSKPSRELGTGSATTSEHPQLLRGFVLTARQRSQPVESLTTVKNLPLVSRCHLPVGKCEG